jgi:hypothetical protein
MALTGRENEVRFNREGADGNLQEVQSIETKDALLERVWTHLPDGRIHLKRAFWTASGDQWETNSFVTNGAPGPLYLGGC